jgi:hypothetical protein
VGRLKYMLLCKIMTSKGDAEEVPAIISSRAGLKYAGDPSLRIVVDWQCLVATPGKTSRPCPDSACRRQLRKVYASGKLISCCRVLSHYR